MTPGTTSLTLSRAHLEILIEASSDFDPGHERFETYCEALVTLRRALDRIKSRERRS